MNSNWNKQVSFVPVSISRSILQFFWEVIERSGTLSVVIALVFATAQAHAGEIEPRAYVNTPVGINFLLAGYVYSDGGLATVASSPIKDADLTMHTGVLAYARSMGLWDKSAKFDVILGYSDLSGSAMVAGQPRERNISGLIDPRLRYSINFYGAPRTVTAGFCQIPPGFNYRGERSDIGSPRTVR